MLYFIMAIFYNILGITERCYPRPLVSKTVFHNVDNYLNYPDLAALLRNLTCNNFHPSDNKMRGLKEKVLINSRNDIVMFE